MRQDARVRIHHLNCGTMRPAGGRLMDGHRGLLRSARLVCHCLLIESGDGLVLVDTGLGTEDVERPRERLGRSFLAGVRPVLDEAETALAQVRRLGFAPGDVRHVVMTHLDLDHAGGLSDFPDAQVHVLDVELDAALHPASLTEHRRYRPPQWAHGPRWAVHGARGEPWLGFDRVEAVGEIFLVPLHGHTRGHAGVAVSRGDGWLFHGGDAFFHHGEVESPPRCPRGLIAFQRLMAVDEAARRHNQERLRDLHAAHPDQVTIVCAHDPSLLSRARGRSAAHPRRAART
jgi:glyoxylase-like metal-dependent hydrolase (beta-lactamase superfamily II)